MISDEHLDQLIDGIAQLASILLDAGANEAVQSAGPDRALDAALQRLDVECTAHSLQGISYVLRLLRKVEPRRQPGVLNPADAGRFAAWVGDLIAYVMGQTGPADSAVVLDDLLPLSWFPRLPDDLTNLVRDRLARDAERLARGSNPVPATGDPDTGDTPLVHVPVAPPAPAQPAATIEETAVPAQTAIDESPPAAWVATEELELVIEAVSMQLLPLAAEVENQGSHDGQRQALADYREQFDLISAAAEALGLPGLGALCMAFAATLDHLASSDAPLDGEQLRLLGEWPVLLIGYLQAPTDPNAAADVAALLDAPGAPWSLTPEEIHALIQQLTHVAIGVDPAMTSARKNLAEAADIALDIADDVLPTVLAGMLLELPGRSAEFSTRIQNYVHTGSTEDLDMARRIAHTLKGDGNIVGVRGIANLTHALEEILIKLGDQPGVPVRELADVLVESADCLEAMSDYVLKRGPAPDNALEALQAVLNWANALHGESIAAVAATAAAPDDEAADTPAVASEEAVEITPEQTISVPTNLLDRLLRLTGEAVIYARQIENRVGRIEQRATEIATQNQALQSLVAELQQLVEVRGAAVGSMRLTLGEEFDALEMDRYNELNTVTLRLVEASADARATSSDVGQDVISVRDLLSLQDRIHLDLQGQVLKTRTLPVSGLLPRLQRVVRQTARQLGKDCDIEFIGEATALDHEIIDRLAEPLVHMLRNAVDHGIEYPEERRHQGKPERGHIALGFQRDAGVVRIHCRDDGRGLDTDAIRRKGIERGFLDPSQPASDEQVSQLIFRPGFSTRSTATQTSGRGIGMDIVHRSIAHLKGSLTLRTEPGKGCEFEIQLPVSQVVADVLLTRTESAMVAIVLHGIDRLVSLEYGALSERDGAVMASIDDQLVPVHTLESLLGYPVTALRRGGTHTALIAKAGTTGTAAVLIGGLGEARSVIVKNLGACVPPMPGVLGATILGDGAIAPVVDLQELIGIHKRLAHTYVEPAAEAPAEAAPHILIVDDSLSVRRSLEQLVGDAGFDVATARDGLEAVERVRERRPDLMLVDLEMPRMNGLELTSFIRKNEPTRTIPIIMITSRTTERHRELARQVGVDTVLSKPYSEEDLLKLIERNLNAAALA